MAKKILLISYHYPPDSSVGRLRAFKFAEHLSHNGYDPIVLTVLPKYYQHAENELETLNNIKVQRTNILPTIKDLYILVRNFVLTCKKEVYNNKNIFPDINSQQPEEENATFSSRLRGLILSLIWLPDDKTGWIPAAFLSGLNLIKRHKIRIIFTTSPPHSTQMVGYLLKKATNVKWIADFRDPWMIDVSNSSKSLQQLRTPISDLIEKRLESAVVATADVVLSITPKLSQAFSKKYAFFPRNKFTSLYSGYCSEDLREFQKTPKNQKFTIVYPGNFFQKRNPFFFLKALSELVTERKVNPDDIHVKFIGSSHYYNGKSIQQMVKGLGISDLVFFSDVIPYRHALQQVAAAHVALLLAPAQPLQIPTKAFDFIGLGSTILTLTDKGSTADLLQQVKTAHVVEYKNTHQIKRTLLALYTRYKEIPDQTFAHPINLSHYDKKHIAKELALLIDHILQ